MINIETLLNLDLDIFLRKIGLEYPDKFASLKQFDKYVHIDKLVERVQSANSEDALIGLVLIFKPIILKTIKKYFPVLRKHYSYEFSDILTVLITEFYFQTKEQYIPQNSDGHKAKFNYFIGRKMVNKMVCLTSKERIYKKYMKKIQQISVGCHHDTYCFDHNEKERIDYIDYIRDILSGYKHIDVYMSFIDGQNITDMSKEYDMHANKVIAIINSYTKILLNELGGMSLSDRLI